MVVRVRLYRLGLGLNRPKLNFFFKLQIDFNSNSNSCISRFHFVRLMSVSKTKFQTLFFEHLSGVCFVNITISDNRKFFPFCVQRSMYIAPWSFFSLSKIIVLSFNSAANLHNCLNSSLTSCYELNNILFVV